MPRPAPSAPVPRIVGGGNRNQARVPGPRGGAQPIVASGALCAHVVYCTYTCSMLCMCMLHTRQRTLVPLILREIVAFSACITPQALLSFVLALCCVVVLRTSPIWNEKLQKTSHFWQEVQ
jgi:hypothetical protein